MDGVPWLRGQREIACCRCRHRKKKCDKRRPVCGECLKSGADCVPLAPKKTAKGHPSVQYVHLLEDHIASLETRLRDSNPSIAGDHLIDEEPPSESLSPAGSQTIELNLQRGTPSQIFDENFEIPRSPLESAIDETFYHDWSLGLFESSLEDPDLTSSVARPATPLPGITAQYDPQTSQGRPIGQKDGFESLVTFNPAPTLHSLSERLAESCLSVSFATRYVTEYFMSAHPMWPFLHHKQWENWWSSCTSQIQDTYSSVSAPFFVDMVLAIGGLLLHSSNPSTDHINTSNSCYRRAITKYNSSAFETVSPVLRTQASLLLTLHAMHLGTVPDLFTFASRAINDQGLSDLAFHQSQESMQTVMQHGLTDIVRKMASRTCIVIDILISNTMDHSVRFEDASIENDDCAQDDESVASEELRLSLPLTCGSLSPSPAEIALEEHMFRLRRIQYRVLRITRKLEQQALEQGHIVPNLWRSSPKYDLDLWMQDINGFSASSERQMRFKSAAWMFKLANYTIISLFPNPELAVRGGDSKHLVAAACLVLATFRKLRVKDHVTCYTWTALLHQFQAGVVVMFCLWATPTHQQQSFYDRRNVCQAMFACLATLGDFANKWPTAGVFRDVFEILTDAIPVSEYGDPGQRWSISPLQGMRLKSMIAELGSMKIQGRVIRMINGMLRTSRPIFTSISVEETRWIQYEHVEERT